MCRALRTAWVSLPDVLHNIANRTAHRQKRRSFSVCLGVDGCSRSIPHAPHAPHPPPPADIGRFNARCGRRCCGNGPSPIALLAGDVFVRCLGHWGNPHASALPLGEMWRCHPERLNHQCECRRWLAPAGIVEMVALELRAPVFKHTHQPTICHVRTELVFRQ